MFAEVFFSHICMENKIAPLVWHLVCSDAKAIEILNEKRQRLCFSFLFRVEALKSPNGKGSFSRIH
jgi:hypothetical protein